MDRFFLTFVAIGCYVHPFIHAQDYYEVIPATVNPAPAQDYYEAPATVNPAPIGCPSQRSFPTGPIDVCSEEFRSMTTSIYKEVIKVIEESLHSIDEIDLDDFMSDLTGDPSLVLELRNAMEELIDSSRNLLEETHCAFSEADTLTSNRIDESCSNQTQRKMKDIHRVLAAPQTPKESCKTTGEEILRPLYSGIELAESGFWVNDKLLDEANYKALAAAFNGIIGGSGSAGATQYTALQFFTLAFKSTMIQAKATITLAKIKLANISITDGGCLFGHVKTIHDVSFEMYDENQRLVVEQVRPHPRFLKPKTSTQAQTRYLQDQPLQAKAKQIFLRAGCDGIDNDGDSILLQPVPVEGTKTVTIRPGLVDECDEDQVPPTITLMRERPKEFPDLNAVKEWYENEDNVKFEDDCATSPALERSIRFEGDDAIVVLVEDTRCSPTTLKEDKFDDVNDPDGAIVTNVIVDTSGKYSVERRFVFVIADSTPPEVKCEFRKRQDLFHVINPPPGGFVPDGTMVPPFPDSTKNEPLHIDARNENGQMWVDVGLHYDITDDSQTEIQVDIGLYSNEYEKGINHGGMFEFIERNDIGNPLVDPAGSATDFVHRAMLFLSPYSCKSESKGRKGSKANDGKLCVEEVNGENNLDINFPITTRFYDIIIKATDKTGNVGETQCTVIVVPDNDEHYTYIKSSGKNSSTNLGKGNGKGNKIVPTHDPNDLVEEYKISQKRFNLGTYSHVWDFELSDVLTPLPTAAPTVAGTGKAGKGKTNGKATIGNIKEKIHTSQRSSRGSRRKERIGILRNAEWNG